MADINPSSNSAVKVGRMLIFVLAACLAGIVIYRYYSGQTGDYTIVPKEMQINYIPADFDANIDPEDALVILSNPHRYKNDFNKLIYNLNISLLRHVGKRMGLNQEQMALAEKEYEKQHPYLRSLYFNEFVAMKDTTSTLYQTWYDNESTNAVEILNEVASKYTCFLVNQIITTILPTEGGKLFGKGNKVDTPCGIALTEALRPTLKKWEERAAIDDFSRSKGLLQEKVERVIAELATMEIRDKKGVNKQMQTKIWGFSVSSSDIEITAISVLKVGFRLHDYFDISLSSKSGVVTITLPEPVILSHEVYPKIDKLDIGWMREVKNINLNQSFNLLREEFRREAYADDVMDKSKTQAVELMNTIFTPLLSSMDKRYKLKVRFKAPEKDIEEIEDESRPLD
ncbi:MAG: hypothetical protein DHS20C18_15370 [Saprospiraceae bacterium]|nr:MAG: hypothetical protein DHS20C18_15370 [Saprospiraceae bacterium]